MLYFKWYTAKCRKHNQIYTIEKIADGKTLRSLRCNLACQTVKKHFCCSVCNTGFTDSESLIKHMRVHVGQTQFRCSICDQEFVWRRHLTKHMEIHTSEKIYSCIPSC
uniref:C2H2-type domain-containing protein n=1 Tax=Labrus bergylta TaxID=56723 RepID=A0A3Q3E5W6_9LABR